MLTLYAINHLIKQNSNVQDSFVFFHQKIIEIDLNGFKLKGCINSEGLLEKSQYEADVFLIFTQSSIQKILQGKKPGVGDIKLRGNTQLAAEVLNLLGQLNYSFGKDINRWVGDEIVNLVPNDKNADSPRGLIHLFNESKNFVFKNLLQNNHSFNKNNVNSLEIERWAHAVDKVRDDVERLAAKITKIEKNIL